MLKGFKHSEETKIKMSLAKKGKKPYVMTDEIRKNMSLARKGWKLSEEHIRNIRKMNGLRKGKPFSGIHSNWKGKKHS